MITTYKIRLDYWIFNIFSIVISAGLLLFANFDAITLCYVFSIIGVFYGVSQTVGYFFEKSTSAVYTNYFSTGVLTALFCALMIFFAPQVAENIILYTIFATAINAVFKLQNAMDLSRRAIKMWWIMLAVFGVLMSLCLYVYSAVLPLLQNGEHWFLVSCIANSAANIVSGVFYNIASLKRAEAKQQLSKDVITQKAQSDLNEAKEIKTDTVEFPAVIGKKYKSEKEKKAAKKIEKEKPIDEEKIKNDIMVDLATKMDIDDFDETASTDTQELPLIKDKAAAGAIGEAPSDAKGTADPVTVTFDIKNADDNKSLPLTADEQDEKVESTTSSDSAEGAEATESDEDIKGADTANLNAAGGEIIKPTQKELS